MSSHSNQNDQKPRHTCQWREWSGDLTVFLFLKYKTQVTKWLSRTLFHIYWRGGFDTARARHPMTIEKVTIYLDRPHSFSVLLRRKQMIQCSASVHSGDIWTNTSSASYQLSHNHTLPEIWAYATTHQVLLIHTCVLHVHVSFILPRWISSSLQQH